MVVEVVGAVAVEELGEGAGVLKYKYICLAAAAAAGGAAGRLDTSVSGPAVRGESSPRAACPPLRDLRAPARGRTKAGERHALNMRKYREKRERMQP